MVFYLGATVKGVMRGKYEEEGRKMERGGNGEVEKKDKVQEEAVRGKMGHQIKPEK